MSIQKLAKSFVNITKEVVSSGVKKMQTKKPSQQLDIAKITNTMDALSVQGKAIVKKFDNVTDKIASKLDDASGKIQGATTKNTSKADFSKIVGEQVNKTTIDKTTDCMISSVKKILDDKFDGKKLIFDGNNLVYVKSAEESAKAIDAQLTFKELAEAGLSHKSAKESAGVFQEAAKKHTVDLKNELSAKYTPEQIKQAKLKRELKAKYADKLNNK